MMSYSPSAGQSEANTASLLATTTIEVLTSAMLRRWFRTNSTDAALATGSHAARTIPEVGRPATASPERSAAEPFADAHGLPLRQPDKTWKTSSTRLPQQGLEALFDLVHALREVEDAGRPGPTRFAKLPHPGGRLQ